MKTPNAEKQLGILLIITLFILIFQVMLGGITRLTGSGLSITEWKVIEGTLPPFGAAQWQEKFDLYKTIPQYQLLNEGMSMSEFKMIFFWEWFHRFWGRIGFMFLAGMFAFFAFKKQLTKRSVWLFLGVLALYGLQGVLGWFMVASGLSELTHVSHYRLAAHLVTALILFAFILWWAADLLVPKENKISNKKHKTIGWSLAVLVLVQIIFGAFMSGLRLAGRYATWPDMNGQYIPDNLFLQHLPFWQNFTENAATIQFTHRMLAYFLFLALMAFWWYARRQSSGRPVFKTAINLLPIFLTIQVLLGITTLVLSSGDYIPVLWGVAHQFMGLTLLSTLLFVNFQYSK